MATYESYTHERARSGRQVRRSGVVGVVRQTRDDVVSRTEWAFVDRESIEREWAECEADVNDADEFFEHVSRSIDQAIREAEERGENQSKRLKSVPPPKGK